MSGAAASPDLHGLRIDAAEAEPRFASTVSGASVLRKAFGELTDRLTCRLIALPY